MATALITTTTVWGSRISSNIGEVVSPNPKPIAPITKAAPISTNEVTTMCNMSGISYGVIGPNGRVSAKILNVL